MAPPPPAKASGGAAPSAHFYDARHFLRPPNESTEAKGPPVGRTRPGERPHPRAAPRCAAPAAMAPKGANLLGVLAAFRTGQIKGTQMVAEAAAEREERLAKAAAKKAAPKKAGGAARRRAAPAASADAPSGSPSAGASGDWRRSLAAPVLPLGLRLKQVLDFLRAREAPATAAQIFAATKHDPSAEPDLARELAANPKVAADLEARTYAYSAHAGLVRDRAALLDHLRRAGAPVPLSEVADAYGAVAEDLAAIKAEGLVVGLHSFDPAVAGEVLFTTDIRLAGLAVDAEVAAVWHATELPDDEEELAAELRRAGLAPAPRRAPRKRAAADKKKRKRKATRLRAVTNVHLMHLLEGEGADAIDAPPAALC